MSRSGFTFCPARPCCATQLVSGRLKPGDLVAFPSGYVGAHTVAGPGRFMILSTGDHLEPWISVYPDSDKVAGPGGMLLRSSAVSYWHGEGTDPPVEQVSAKREPPTAARQPSRQCPLLPGRRSAT